MSTELQAAIDRLVARIDEQERKTNGLKQAVNVLCEEGGFPLRYPNVGEDKGGTASATLSSITDHTFYGKRQQTAAREYLEMRKSPAKPREIYDALKSGGLQFEATDEEMALQSIRSMLRKRRAFFHKLPTGAYGLTTWYEHLKNKPASDDDDDDEGDADKKTAAPKKKAAASKLRKSRAPRKGKRGSEKPPERKEEPDAIHQSDVSGPVKAAEAA